MNDEIWISREVLDVTNTDEKLYLNIAEAAEYIGVSRPTMIAWANRGDFPAVRSGRRWIIPREALSRWMDDRARERAQL